MIYPEQFGEAPVLTSFTDPLSSDIGSASSPILVRLRQRLLRFKSRNNRYQ